MAGTSGATAVSRSSPKEEDTGRLLPPGVGGSHHDNGNRPQERSKWTKEETDELVDLVDAHGTRDWRAILDASKSMKLKRSPVDLKDKWRDLARERGEARNPPIDAATAPAPSRAASSPAPSSAPAPVSASLLDPAPLEVAQNTSAQEQDVGGRVSSEPAEEKTHLDDAHPPRTVDERVVFSEEREPALNSTGEQSKSAREREPEPDPELEPKPVPELAPEPDPELAPEPTPKLVPAVANAGGDGRTLPPVPPSTTINTINTTSSSSSIPWRKLPSADQLDPSFHHRYRLALDSTEGAAQADEVWEDVCFVCKDGGHLVTCDYGHEDEDGDVDDDGDDDGGEGDGNGHGGKKTKGNGETRDSQGATAGAVVILRPKQESATASRRRRRQSSLRTKCWKAFHVSCAQGLPPPPGPDDGNDGENAAPAPALEGIFHCFRHRCAVEGCERHGEGRGGIRSACLTCPRSCCEAHRRENVLGVFGVLGGGGGGGSVGSAGADIAHVTCGMCRELECRRRGGVKRRREDSGR